MKTMRTEAMANAAPRGAAHGADCASNRAIGRRRVPLDCSRNRLHRRRGFSLIEILIAVLILALGMLGLGAIFPVVIRQQAASRDRTMGILAANTAVSQIGGLTDLDRAYWLRFAHGRNGQPGGGDDFGGLGNGVRWWTGEGGRADDGATLRLRVPPPVGGPVRQVFFPITERLYPNDGRSNPEYVWDLAASMVTDGLNAGGVRVVVFVRRIDANIRVPRDMTLLQLLTEPDPERMPIGEDNNGRPTFNGTGGNYSRPRQIQVRPDRDDPDDPDNSVASRVRLPPQDNNPTTGLVGQVGQVFVDLYGNLYTVTGTEMEMGQRYATVTPPVPASVINSLTNNDLWCVMTPQVPAQVHTFEVAP